jgi:hypothetical protein
VRSTCWLAIFCLGAAAPSVLAEERPCPIAAHNCYSDVSVKAAEQRLAEALSVGLRYIEVDVNLQPSAGGFVVTHRSDKPPTRPLLQDYLKPLWAKWREEPFDHILIVEFKAGPREQIGKAFHDYLLPYRDVLNTFAPDGSPRSRGRISVALTGSGTLMQAYIDYARQQGELLARRDQGFSGPLARGALKEFLKQPAPQGVGYLTVEWNVVVGSARAYFTPMSAANRFWLAEIVAGARRNHYTLRFYTLNPRYTFHRGEPIVAGDWDTAWAECAKAGVDMIATDQYALGVQWWERIGRRLNRNP